MARDFEKLMSIFRQALEEHAPEEWDDFVRKAAGGDEELCRQAGQLLHAHARGDSLLDRPILPGATVDQTVAEKPGAQIGRYKLLQKIGEGGFGVVYLADQQQPVRRKVALKVIKPGMDTKEVIARFEAERQALALMEHPNIAKVLDGGTTESGRPYFVMELVKGMPLTEFCDRNRFTARQRLELFSIVCRAVQHAHHKGVIHRDLKPSNVMVTLHDGRPVPKVIDFGVSKAISQQLTEKTMFTAYGQMIGTPQYMSPEQAEMSGLDIDTRSDIFSLGVLLYELLTGGTPLDVERLRNTAYAEMQRLIREEEPPMPSARLTALGGASALVASQRGTEPGKLTALLRGDLDWIVMKALDKDRVRRYDTANNFAADIERFLGDQAVEARPPSAAYRLRKFARRHRAAAATIVSFAAVLVLATVASSLLALRAKRAEDNARRALMDATEARQSETEARRAAEQERDAASAARRRVEQARYATQIGLAQRELEAGNVELAGQILEECPAQYRHWEHAYLDTLLRHRRRSYSGQSGDVNAVAMSPDGRRIASAGSDKTVVVWDVETQNMVRTLEGHEGAVSSVAFSPDGKHIAAGGADQTVRLWDAESGVGLSVLAADPSRPPQSPPSPPHVVQRVEFSPDGRLVLAGEFGVTRVWDVDAGRSVGAIKENVVAPVFSADGKQIVGGVHGPEGKLCLWDVGTGEEVRVFKGHQKLVASVALSPDGKRLVSGGDDGTVRLWDVGTGKELLTLYFPPTAAIARAAFARDGEWIVAADQRGHVKIWDAASGRPLGNAKIGAQMHFQSPNQVAFSRDGKLAVTGVKRHMPEGGGVQVWGLTVEPHSVTFGQEGPAKKIGFVRQGKWIVTQCLTSQDTRVWSSATGQEVPSWRPSFSYQDADLCPDGKLLALARGNGTVQLVDFASGRTVRILATGDDAIPVASVSFSRDGRQVAAGGRGGQVWVWDADSGVRQRTLSGHDGVVSSVAFGSAGRRLVTAGADGARIWDLCSGTQLAPVAGHARQIKAACFSPDGRILLTGSLDRAARLWDAESGREVTTLAPAFGAVRGAAFSPDGQRIATAGDGTLGIWDAQTFQLLLQIGIEEAGDVVAFSPDGRQIAAGGGNTVRVWGAAPPPQPQL